MSDLGLRLSLHHGLRLCLDDLRLRLHDLRLSLGRLGLSLDGLGLRLNDRLGLGHHTRRCHGLHGGLGLSDLRLGQGLCSWLGLRLHDLRLRLYDLRLCLGRLGLSLDGLGLWLNDRLVLGMHRR